MLPASSWTMADPTPALASCAPAPPVAGATVPRVISAITATITNTAATASNASSRLLPPRRGIVPTPPGAAPCACITVPPSVASVGYRASSLAGARYRNVTRGVTRSCFRSRCLHDGYPNLRTRVRLGHAPLSPRPCSPPDSSDAESSPSTVRADYAPQVRLSASVGEEPQVEVGLV